MDRLLASAAALRLEDVPPSVVEHASRLFADTVGVCLGGSQCPEMRAFLAVDGPLFAAVGGGGTAQILAQGFPWTSSETAAFTNATSGTFLELDEGCRPTGHPGMHTVPAALAVGQAAGSSGEELLAAVIAGYEITARLFGAYRLTYPLHPHGHFGAVGAAVAVARLTGGNASEAAYIAATLPLLTVWQPCTEGATARNAWSGVASFVGILSNRMAMSGFRGSRQAQVAAFGELVGDLVHPELLDTPLDPAQLGITRNYLKFHSACALNHSALDAVLSLGPIPISEITGVKVETVSNNMKIARQAQLNSLSTRFSIPYAVATALVHGHTRPEAFEPDGAVAELAGRVEVVVAEDLESAWPDAAPARVTVHTADGERIAEVRNPRGHYSNPASAEELRSKFEMLTEGYGVGDLYDRLLNVTSCRSVARLFEGL